MQRWRGAVVPAWSVLLAAVLLAPTFASGYVLTHDMVWVPRLDLDRPELWGLGTGLPRAVPSDAFAALLGAVLPAAVVQRVVLLGALVLTSLGAAAMLRGGTTTARLAAATLAVWNPFVVERLVLGQWPLLLAVAGLMWLVVEMTAPGGARWSVVTLALAATALTPATGVMGLVAAVVVAWRRGVVGVVLVAALVNLPWVVAGLQHAAISRTDAAAVRLFEVQAEGALGRLGSALTLGGIWNRDVVPTSRTLVVVLVPLALMAVVVVLGLVALWIEQRRAVVVLAVVGLLGLAVALAGWVAPGLVEQVVAEVPGGGLVRDGTRWLALLLPLEAVAFGAGLDELADRLYPGPWSAPSVVLTLMLPFVALPDAAWGVSGRLEPVDYPAALVDARSVVSTTDVAGDAVALPFSAYRAPAWNGGRPVLDPLGRFLDRTTVTNDELVVSGRTIRGEDPRAARVATALAGDDVLRDLADEGIGVVVVDTTAPGAGDALDRVAGADELEVAGDGLRVFTLPDAEERRVDDGERQALLLAWALTGLTIACALLGALLRIVDALGRVRSDRKAAKDRARKVSQS